MKDNTERINELALQLKDGDKSVFDELYSLTCSKAYFIAFQISGDKHEAEDIVQDSYITALSKISSLEKTESFMSWFNRIVANRSKDVLKKRKPRVFTEDEEKAFTVIADDKTEFSPESNIDRDELRLAVMEAIKELGAEKRACVLMKYFEDMSVNEIAESMEVPVSTVKNRLWKARSELKNLFERKGITAAYSVAPFGAVTWALNSTFEAFSQNFESSASAAKILSGIAVASTAAAGTAAATATGSGIAAKVAAASTFQKIVSGIVVAGVVTGSTVGITSVVKNRQKTEENTPSVSYTETVESEDILSEEITPAVNIIEPDPQKNGEEYENKIFNSGFRGNMPQEISYKGTLKFGSNMITFDDDEYYYVDFNAEQDGYYYFKCDMFDPVNRCYIIVPADPKNGIINGYADTEQQFSPFDNAQIYYLEKGNNILLIHKDGKLDSSKIEVKYIGEEITDIIIEQEDLDNVVFQYNEFYNNSWFLYQEQNNGRYANFFRVKLVLPSGDTFDCGDLCLSYTVEGGELKEGKNTIVFFIGGKEYKKEIMARPVTYYVKDIEVTNLDEFTTAQINEEGFTYNLPENFDVIVTYADGSKETFDGKTWDGFINFDNGVQLKAMMNKSKIYSSGSMDHRLRSREPIRFTVSIGETYFIDEICTVTEFDVIGYRKRLDENNLEEAREYSVNIKEGIEIMKENADTPEEYLWYSAELSKITAYNSYKIAHRVAGFELDYAITTFKILTENKFDLV
ncbi:MAG: sigma-70 family RNA polymerase sigma factor [Clostridia bacterium]|nr:sigma-70 family RNA polymerase sigma factor [Clostridia bacterium]